MRKKTKIRESYTQDISIIGRKFLSIEIKIPFRVIYSDEDDSMVLEHESFVFLNIKKDKKKEIRTTSTSFYGVYDFLLPRYNAIISQIDNIKKIM